MSLANLLIFTVIWCWHKRTLTTAWSNGIASDEVTRELPQTPYWASETMSKPEVSEQTGQSSYKNHMSHKTLRND